MRRRSLLKGLAPAFALSGAQLLYAETFLSTNQAQKLLFPDEKLTAVPLTLTPEQRKAIEKAANVRVRSAAIQAWKASGGGWLFVDNVVGKHEFIDFAVALTASGSVKGVEVLTYRETYGGEVRNPKWRAQFSGKTVSAPVKIDADIKNISGATLSSVHITDGVRRLLHTWQIALRQ